MQYVFWQNILSIHQAPFLKELAEKNVVTLVVEKELDNIRISDGWNIPDFGKVKVCIQPNINKIESFFEREDVVHIFSGLNFSNYPSLKKAFNIAIRKKAKLGIMSEPFRRQGLKGKLRSLTYLYYRLKLNKYISFILVTGQEGRDSYESVGFPKGKIFDWGYFTKEMECCSEFDQKPVISFLFIGSIDTRKNILALVDTFLKLDTNKCLLNIIGKGNLEDALLEKIKNISNINYIGSVKNQETPSFIMNADVLVLPSIFDGWGAVVNESLMCGTPVIVSDRCGSSILVRDSERGEVFSLNNNSLEKVLQKFLDKGKVNQKKRLKIKEWADKNISGKAASLYFQNIINYIMFNKVDRPIAPWLNDK